jgi:hypothetical protein
MNDVDLLVDRLLDQIAAEHRGKCLGRKFVCTCGYERKSDDLMCQAIAAIEIMRLRAKGKS